MRRIRLGGNFVVFLLFFGISLFDAVQSQNFIKGVSWFAIGFVFLLSDLRKNTK
jgi:hypothetical protein